MEKADASQNVIYGFITRYQGIRQLCESLFCGYRLDVPQWKLNELLDELQLMETTDLMK